MRINVGSKNKAKVEAVRESIKDYDLLRDAKVFEQNVSSEISEQPKSINETIKGAMNRAKNVFMNCDYSFGIEDGLMKVPYTKTDYMNICACVIYDGREYYVGLSSAFEYPHNVMKLVFEEGLDISQAFNKVGLTNNPQIGSAEGVIAILTKNRLLRKEYTKQSIIMAMIHLENAKLF
jgi:inosine/xanthosine triphosphatase